jgi:hypothetical protein
MLQIYDAETLERLPVTDPGQGEVAADGQTLVLPVILENGANQ